MTTTTLSHTSTVHWDGGDATVAFAWAADEPVHVASIGVDGRTVRVHAVPAVEIISADRGSVPASYRLVHSEIGAQLRYVDHVESRHGTTRSLRIRQRAGGIEAVLQLESDDDVAGFRAQVTVTNLSAEPLVLFSVASWAMGFTADGSTDRALSGWQLVSGRSDWLAEGRWTTTALEGPEFPDLAENRTGHNPRGAFIVTSDGTWSTGRHLPVGIIANDELDLAVAWQIEHNGAWRWEIGRDTAGAFLALSGPTDVDSAWSLPLGTDESFTTVPVSVALGRSRVAAIAALTDYRRRTRRSHVDNARMPVVFNDYMNTLDGDPTTEKLLPLIASAAEAGAEVFCIDAGWYDDSGHWWASVGEWLPSTTRFPGGLAEVIDAIRASGMVPGLWLEPEVVGVESAAADTLPQDAFLQRSGVRVVEHHRYHLDLRHPAARAHLDEVVDRLVRDFGIGFIKMDYNINPGPGTDRDAASVGDGLLQHNRAHLAWLDAVLDRHPELVIENCSSGAMRQDWAMLSRLAMQSTSDQQDFTKYPPIAAAAPLSMLPEQAASWAYPQPEMSDEQIAFCLVTGLLGRFYVSGYLNRMTGGQRALVAEAVRAAKDLRPIIATAAPHWPTGLPGWTDRVVSLGLHAGDTDLVSLWQRDGEASHVALALPHLTGRDVTVSTVFPADLPDWPTEWDATSGTLTVHTTDAIPAARTFRLTTPLNPTA
ncbi:glycoside hydrolase family 36 protein [Microbacterium sp. cx-59]|uniref:glycoside hydrolase family 36 protein n=1 Tax=Microbacterium sp. cx-59 TaxID=2891207 RepID=UPI001E2EB272|nr:glycoside hydrolase family 36 protein [Microbacterium sp. cx-59]MCC4908065.1 alpha-galactosidase [Microbacterium sp. cx-59]